NDRYVEIWGIVFSQYNAVNGVSRENYKELPHKNIDTGAGLERICCVIQETETNFETDLFFPIIKATEKLCNKPYEGQYLMPYRVIADHIRTCTFALADGETFSNEGRGYVLRRLLRRACRYAQKLGLYEPFLYKLVDAVVEVMEPYYPYLVGKKEQIAKTIKNEEEKFIKTLTVGESILNQMIKGKKELQGEDAFKLYDTYGFPIELTKEICLDSDVVVDEEGFKTALNHQKKWLEHQEKTLNHLISNPKIY
ncbi:MAG: alanine--tRNA ligase, partial [Bacilli bacterium]|nr:alanine--tRNA ligase [Bacilli bacterium]